MRKKNGGDATPKKQATTKKPATKKKAVKRKPTGGKREGAGRKSILDQPTPEETKQLWLQIDTWLMKGLEGTGIAARLGVHADTLDNYGRKCKKWGGTDCEAVEFSAYKAQKRAIGDQNLHERQYDTAMGIFEKVDDPDNPNRKKTVMIAAPNVSMQIWLGKNRLDQSDKNDIVSGGEPLQQAAPVTLQIIQNPTPDKK